MTAQIATQTATVTPIKTRKRKLTTLEKAQRKEAKMNVQVSIVEELRAVGDVYYADYGVHTMAQRHGLSSIQFLFSILSVARPYKSVSCDNFIDNDLCGIIANMVEDNYWYKDNIGNIIVSIGDNNTTLWSCHTDTVHPKHSGYSDLAYNGKYVTSKDKRQLGADDGVGIWLMLNMIEAGVEGLYVFHAGEEVGGIGSTYIARNTPELLRGITHAIAFDRKALGSVITHMGFGMGGRCCSDLFAKDFAAKLGIGHYPDSTGIYTDTAEYTHLVHECTNISAGYYSEHTFSEYLDYEYAEKLLNAVLTAYRQGDLDDLAIGRDCEVFEDILDTYSFDNDDQAVSNYGNRYYDNMAGAAFGSKRNMLDIIRTYPAGIAEVLKEFGIDAEYLENYLDL